MADPHAGSWRGIFWHKNFTGSLMAFGTMIFLFSGLTAPDHNNVRKIICAFGYVLAVIFVVYSRSAAGVAIWLGLSAGTISLFIWTKIKYRMTRTHYIVLAAGILALVLSALWKLDFIFSLLNRESSLTGRLPLWNHLFSEAGNRPILGHGFGAIWLLRDFRAQVTRAQGWSFIITNSHNGYMDILLGLGALGLLLALAISIIALYRGWRYFINDGRMESSLPLLIALYFLLANLSISFFLESEVFHWVLLVAILFSTTSAKQGATTATELTRTNMLLAPREPPKLS
jgi:O-antigen ligase